MNDLDHDAAMTVIAVTGSIDDLIRESMDREMAPRIARDWPDLHRSYVALGRMLARMKPQLEAAE